MQRHCISGHGAVEFLPREAVDVLHQLFNVQVKPALRAWQGTAQPERGRVVSRTRGRERCGAGFVQSCRPARLCAARLRAAPALRAELAVGPARMCRRLDRRGPDHADMSNASTLTMLTTHKHPVRAGQPGSQ